VASSKRIRDMSYRVPPGSVDRDRVCDLNVSLATIFTPQSSRSTKRARAASLPIAIDSGSSSF
jgi:hypothetical protein